MNTQMLSLFPTDVLVGKLDLATITPVVNAMLINQDKIPKRTYESFNDPGEEVDLDDPRVVDVKSFVENSVKDLFKQYCKQSCDYDLEEGTYRLHVGCNTGMDKSGYMEVFHNHPESLLTAIFYLLVEDSDVHGGKLLVHDPRFNANRGMTPNKFRAKHQDFVFSPESGSFIIVPSYMFHSVTRFNGNIRMVMPINLELFNN